MTGRTPVFTSIAISDSSSDRVPIVEPTTDSCRKKTRLRSAGGFGPLVAPQTTIVPPGARDFSECDQVASPTVSITASTRFGSRASGSKAASAPRASAACRLASVRPVTHIR